MYSSATNQVKKTISRFKEAAYSGCFRHDGRLLAAGSEEGVVKVEKCLNAYTRSVQKLTNQQYIHVCYRYSVCRSLAVLRNCVSGWCVYRLSFSPQVFDINSRAILRQCKGHSK